MGGVTLKSLPKEDDNDYPEGETRKSCSNGQGCEQQRNGYPFRVFLLQAFEDKDELFLKR